MAPETDKPKVHLNWLRIMYVYTIVGAGGIGLAFLIAPSTMLSLLMFPAEEPILAGIAYSVWLAFGILSAIGLRSPLKFAPVLLLQLTYKVIWFVAVIIPQLLLGPLPLFATVLSGIYATYVIGDIIVIPWQHLFAK